MKEIINKYFVGNILAQQIFLFLIIGGLCYVIAMTVLILLVEAGGMEVNLANFIASLIAIYAAYILNSRFIFQPGKYSQVKEITAFFIFSFIGLIINVTLMFLMTKYLPISYIVSKTIVTILVAAFNFLTRKFIIFQS